MIVYPIPLQYMLIMTYKHSGACHVKTLSFPKLFELVKFIKPFNNDQ